MSPAANAGSRNRQNMRERLIDFIIPDFVLRIAN
jgi:hypothetical protein